MNNYVLFYGHDIKKSEYNVFSQWYPATFVEVFGGLKITYQNAEQYMMAHKALLFGDSVMLKNILTDSRPAMVKKYGRAIKNFDPVIWDQHKLDIVIEGNYLKFSQNPSLLETLLKTDNKIICEASPFDKIWGIGISYDRAIKIPANQWPGLNLLGKSLMVVRSKLIEHQH